MGKFREMCFTVLKLSGGAAKFLNGLAVSNTPDTPRNGFLDIYGRIVAVFYQSATPDGSVFIAFPSKFRQRLEAHLEPYLALGKTRLEETGCKAFFIIGEDENGLEGIKIREKAGSVLLSKTSPAGMEEMDEQEFSSFRFENGISMQGMEFDSEMIMNTDWQDSVSLTKGCFLGQEIISKIMRRGKPPQRLVRIAFSEEPQRLTRSGNVIGEMRSKCFSKNTGKWIAFCLVPNDGNDSFDGGGILQ